MTNTMVERLYELENGNFWTNVHDLVDEIEELGFEIDDYNREYIVVSTDEDDEDNSFELLLGGTERTIIIKLIKEI